MTTSFSALAQLLIALSLVACGRTTLPPATGNASQQALAGDWVVEFRLDSMRTAGKWQAASSSSARGTLRLTDSSTRSETVRSTIDVDFTPLLGRPMSCFDPRPTSTTISQNGESTSLDFTPGAADCGFGASGKFYGDSLVGTWVETSFIGPMATGRFRMKR
ncbi:MAG TPA: hypothetical protein VGH98_19905 [Gemmatimonadaceae bacterium]|jgi:hypothetical protein